MNRTLGQFYPAESPLHSLDPRAKILAVAALVLGLFLVDSAAGFALVTGALAAGVALSKVPAGVFVKVLRPVIFIAVLTAVFQVFFSREGAVVFQWAFVEVHEGGIRLGFILALRILLLVSAAGLLTATTAPVTLADGIEDLLSPLKKIRVPAQEISMMMTIALRFIPTLQQEAQKIMKAQAARGAEFDDGGPIRRVKAMIPVLVPLTVGAFRRADELAEAMESRGYKGGGGRTRYRELRLGMRDAGMILVVFLVVLGGILL